MALEIASRAEPIAGYRLIDRIGSGGFGDVWKAEAPGGLLKAIKIIHGDLRTADPDGARHAEQELRALKRVQEIRHPFLLSLERYDIVDGRLMIVMELADCNLWDRFRKCRADGLPGLPRKELLGYLEESAEVLDLMSSTYGLQHLDIKPQNLFLIHNHVKVADFGLVKDLEGMRAAITGGVTPVYAAPETFDGVATRFCDQYSLAIVYQELLTGVRPITGSNAQQLLVQHMKGLPNLTPLPPADRPVVGRALAKKPEDRFPSCSEFVQALYDAGTDALNGAMPGSSGAPTTHRYETPRARFSTVSEGGPLPTGARMPPASPPPETPKTELRNQKNEASSPSIDAEIDPLLRPAPPEITGTGALRPALVIGIGQVGIDAVRRFRRAVVERHGSFERLPHLRLMCLDTDIETLAAATSAQSLAPLSANEIVSLRLNRASHYLKPRRNGRSLIEGWFDPQMLYKIPRNPQTLGLRCLGRLAFCDHFRVFSDKLRENFDASLADDALEQADRVTKLGIRTNQPRVYVVAGLGGGAGGGMFLDVAYAVRQRLRQLGYAKPDVVGVLLLPSTDRSGKTPALGNTHAALRELNHFSLPETVFSASHDGDCHIHDAGAPFTQTLVVPFENESRPDGKAAESGARRVADFLRRDLLSPFGRMIDDCRDELPPPSKIAGMVGCVNSQSAYTWPKQQILSQCSRWLGEALVARWLKADLNVIREPLVNWLKERWSSEKFAPEFLTARLQEAADRKVGQPPEALFDAEAQPFAPRGWFAREPDRAKLWQSLSKLVQIVGMPDERAMQRQVGVLESTLNEAGDALLRELTPKLIHLPRSLLEHPDYRLDGATEAIKQLDLMLSQRVEQYEPMLNELAAKATDSYYTLTSYLNDELNTRRVSSADAAECLRTFPKSRLRNLVARQIYRVYLALRGQLSDLAREFHFCRQRLEDLMARFKSLPPEIVATTDQTLFPPGCSSIEQAVQALRESIKPEELRALDKSLQRHIEQSYQALFSVCMSSINMLGNLHGIVEEQARAFLNERVGDSNVGQMFLSRFQGPDQAISALRRVHDQAGLPVKSSQAPGPEICAVLLPEGDQRAVLEQTARQAFAGKVIDFLSSPEEVLVYREWPRLPIAALPAAGSLGRDAYQQMDAAGPNSAHTRTDVGGWFPLDQ
jgi:serine/threonine protein kinase